MPDSDEQSFSQDELDALFSNPDASGDGAPGEAAAPTGDGGSGPPEASTPESQIDTAAGGESVSQADTDALMNSASAEVGADAEEGTQGDSAGDAAFSQADIDALMDASTGAAEASPTPVGDVGGDQPVSQADIDAIMAGGGEAAGDDGGEASAPDTRLDSMGRPFDEFAAAMQAAIEDENPGQAPAASAAPASLPPIPPPPTEPLPLTDFGGSAPPGSDAHRVSMLHDVKLGVKIELGRTRMLLEDVLRMDEGSVVELDKLAGDPVDVYANDRLVARGEVLILNDNFCVRISEVVTQDPHRVTT